MILSETQVQIRDAARPVSRERLAPTAAGRDETHAFPAAELRASGELGFPGVLVPQRMSVCR